MTVENFNTIFQGEDSLLGVENEVVLSSRVASSITDVETNAWRLTGQPVDSTVYDEVIIKIYDPSDDSVAEELRMNIVEFLGIKTAAQNDVLVNGTTGKLFTLGGGTVLVGRTSSNRAMIQAVTYTNSFANFTVTTTGRNAEQGLLDRRIAATQNTSRVRRWLTTWSSTKPAVINSSQISVNNSQTVSWTRGSESYIWARPTLTQDVGTTLPTKRRWATYIDVFWDGATSSWDFEIAPGIYDFYESFDGGFANNQIGPYQTNANDNWDDIWMRVREPDGGYIVTQIQEASPITRPVDWRPQEIISATFLTGESYKINSFNVNWADRQRLTITIEQFPQTGALTLANRERLQTASYDCIDIGAVANQDSFQSGSLWGLLGVSQSAWGIGPVNNQNSAGPDKAIFRLNLMHDNINGAVGDKASNRWTFRRWNTSKQWKITVRLY